MAFFNFFGGNNGDKAQRKELIRSFDFAQNTWVDLNGKKVGKIDSRLITFPDWLSMELIDEDHLNNLIVNYDEEMESIPVFSVHPEEKRVVPINGTTTVLAMLRKERAEIPGVFITYVGSIADRTEWEQDFFAHIDDLQMKKNANRTLAARAGKDDVARQIMELIDTHPILHRDNTGSLSGRISSGTIAALEKWCEREGIEFIKELVHIWELCGFTKGAMQFTYVDVIADVFCTYKYRSNSINATEIARRMIHAMEGKTWASFYTYHRRTEQFCDMGDMPGAKAMLLYCCEKKMRAVDLPKVRKAEEVQKEVKELLQVAGEETEIETMVDTNDDIDTIEAAGSEEETNPMTGGVTLDEE